MQNEFDIEGLVSKFEAEWIRPGREETNYSVRHIPVAKREEFMDELQARLQGRFSNYLVDVVPFGPGQIKASKIPK